MPLTDKAIQAAKPKEKPYKLADFDGLYMLVSPAGGKHWKLKYYYLGKEKKLSFGSYPLVTLAEAREKAMAARKMKVQEVDPALEKRKDKARTKLESETTFEVVARAWHAKNVSGWTENHGSYNLRRLERDIFPAFGAMPIKDVTVQDIIGAIRKVEERKAHEVARRLKQMCGQVFRYAIVEGLVQHNPVATFMNRDALKPYSKGHYAAFDANALPEFLQKLERNEARLYAHTRLGMKLLMMTFVRTSELIEAEWDEFNLAEAEWIIPASRMKMRRDHIVPLSQQALAVLKELAEYRFIRTHDDFPDYVFPSQINPRTHMSNNTILKALERMGYKGEMTGHGFRSLAMSTIKEKLGYRHEVVDRQLAHAPRNKIDAAYDRAQFLPDRCKMMQEWADYLDELARGGNVVQMRRAG